MKGISPLIAVVLLVAFTVAVGGILMLWFTSMTRTTTTGTQSQSQAIVRCSQADFTVLAIKTGGGQANITVTHYGSNLKFYPSTIRYNTGDVSVYPSTMGTISGSIPISAGDVVTLNVSNFPSGASQLFVTAVCEYAGSVNTTVEASCTKGESCWLP